jgi:hypothetical protein
MKWIYGAFSALAFLTFAFLVPAVTQAQPQLRQIIAKPDKSWTHKATGLEFPASISGMARGEIVDSSNAEWDVFSSYDNADRTEELSVYLYETQLPDSNVWFQVSQRAIADREKLVEREKLSLPRFGDLTPLGDAVAFALPGQTTKSGWRISYSTIRDYKSTALAVVPFGGHWLIKLRLSSKVKTATEIDTAFANIIAAMPWPADKVSQPAAYTVMACEKPMDNLPRSENVKFKTTQDLMNVALGPIGSDVARLYNQGGTKPSYCLDSKMADGTQIFRQKGEGENYYIALGDNGTAIHVEKDVLGAMLAFNPADPQAMERKAADPDYTVALLSPGKAIVFQPQTTASPPEQALEIIDHSAWVVSNSRIGDKDGVDINPLFIDEADKRRFGMH